MQVLEKIYWLRVGLGILAALICSWYSTIVESDIYLLMNSISLTLIIYLTSYYLIKYRYLTLVEKPHKIFTTGIGIYFLSWLVFWVLFYTILHPISA